jgi:hypothetical protein
MPCCLYAPAKHTTDGQGRPLKRTLSNESYSSLSLAIKAMTRFGPSSANLPQMGKSGSSQRLYGSSPYLSKLESIASSAVRAADKVQASLIVVYTHTGGCGGFGDTQGGCCPECMRSGGSATAAPTHPHPHPHILRAVPRSWWVVTTPDCHTPRLPTHTRIQVPPPPTL